MMIKRGRHLITALLVFLLPVIFESAGYAQQVGFGLYADEDLVVTTLVPDELDFGSRISGEGPVSILLSDEEVVVLEIEGVAYLDVTVTLTPPMNNFILLMGDENYLNDANRRMPINVKMAYYNRGQPNIDIPTAKQQAIEVTGHMATFQIRRRPGGPPGPPPIPPHAGYTPPSAKAYLFIYGDITVGNVNAGPYSGIIDIHIEYSAYD